MKGNNITEQFIYRESAQWKDQHTNRNRNTESIPNTTKKANIMQRSKKTLLQVVHQGRKQFTVGGETMNRIVLWMRTSSGDSRILLLISMKMLLQYFIRNLERDIRKHVDVNFHKNLERQFHPIFNECGCLEITRKQTYFVRNTENRQISS